MIAYGPNRLDSIGFLGEASFMVFAAKNGWQVYAGFGNTACDFIADTGKELIRVEVKCSTHEQFIRSGKYYKICRVDPSKFDYLFVHTSIAQYWIPADKCTPDASGGMQLPVPRNYDESRGVLRRYSEYRISDEAG